VGSSSQQTTRFEVFELRSVTPAGGPQLLHVEAAPGPGHDHGLDPLAPLLVRNPDDDRVEHVRMAQQDVLDLRGGDVLRTPDDRVVHPALDVEEALLVQPSVVPGDVNTASSASRCGRPPTSRACRRFRPQPWSIDRLGADFVPPARRVG